MERHLALIVCAADRIGRCIDYELNDIDCHIFVPACEVERQTSLIISSTGSIGKIFEKASNYFLGDSFIEACGTEEFVVAEIITMCQSVPLDYSSYTFLRKRLGFAQLK